MKDLSLTFKALSDETRLRIMGLLLDGRELCVCDLIGGLDLPQSTISRHLAILRKAELVCDRRQGIWMFYTINRRNPAVGDPLWKMLAATLRSRPQATSDQEALKKFLAVKRTDACN